MISIGAFVVSLSGIILLLYFRLWEIKRGSRLFDVQRKGLDEKIISFNVYIQNYIPTFNLTIIYNVYHTLVHYFAIIMLNVLIITERKINSLLDHIRGRREIKNIDTQSDFLKQVGDYKQSLEKPSKDAVE